MSNPFLIPENEIKDRDLKGELKKRWVEDHFPTEGKEGFLGTLIDKKRLNGLIIISIFVLIILFLRTAWLEVIKGDYYYRLAQINRAKIQTIEAPRGLIYDRHNKLLVKNVPTFSLLLFPQYLAWEPKEKLFQIQKLAKMLNKPNWEILKILKENNSSSYLPIIVEDNLDYPKALSLIVQTVEIPYLKVGVNNQRQYLDNLSHLLGYLGKINKEEWTGLKDKGYVFWDLVGRAGLEASWEDTLKGKRGEIKIEVDAKGKEKGVIDKQEPKTGNTLVLSLDLDLQNKIESILVNVFKKNGKTKGIVVALNPNNGEVEALVSLPSYNNNDFVLGIDPEKYQTLLNNSDRPFFFRAISGQYPSGSTIKPVIAAAALEEGIISSTTIIKSTGGIQIGKWFFPDWKKDGHGLVNLKQALAQSVNTFFYTISGGNQDLEGLGPENIIKWAKLFGLSQKLGIDLPGEQPGFLPSRTWKEKIKQEKWYIGDTYHLSIGQGDILVTPLQIASMISVFANGGKLYKPYLVKEILASDEQVIKKIEPQIIREKFLSEQNIKAVREGLREAVVSGSARRLSSLTVPLAGKTGTAETQNNKFHSWLTGFAPYDSPQIALAVLIEEGGEGSGLALEVAKEIWEWYFRQN